MFFQAFSSLYAFVFLLNICEAGPDDSEAYGPESGPYVSELFEATAPKVGQNLTGDSSAEPFDEPDPPKTDNEGAGNTLALPKRDSAENSKNPEPTSYSGNNIRTMDVSQLSKIPGYTYSSAEMSRLKLWEGGVIPFYIDDHSYDNVLRDSIREHLSNANAATGLQFMELTKPPTDDDTRWVFFVNRRGQLNCTDYNSNSFTGSGVQKIVIGYDCFSNGGDIAATVLALAGVPPQHNAPDRDKYIKVSVKSIRPDKIKLFEAVKPQDWLFHDMKYDFQSAGHYPWHKHTVDGTATIKPVGKVDEPVGEVKGFSPQDILKVRVLYNNIAAEYKKNIKLPECAKMYRPGPNFPGVKMMNANEISVRKKPVEYVEAAHNAGLEILDGTENKFNSLNNDGNKIDSDEMSLESIITKVNPNKKNDNKLYETGNENDEDYQSNKDLNDIEKVRKGTKSSIGNYYIQAIPKPIETMFKQSQTGRQHESLTFVKSNNYPNDPMKWSDFTSDS